MATARSMSASDTSSDGAKRSTSGRGALITSPPCSASAQAGRGEVVDQYGGQQQPLAPHVIHPGQPLQAGPQAGPGGGGPLGHRARPP